MKFDEIYKKIKNLINSIEFNIGDKLPSEIKLAKAFGVSRSTLRKAINQLVTDNLIESIQGRGNFIKNKISIQPYNLLTSHHSFPQEMEVKTLNFEIMSAPLAVVNQLKLSVNSNVYFIRQLFCIDDQPIKLRDTFLPISLFVGLSYADLQQTTLSIIKQRFNNQKINSQLQFIPCLASSELANLLAVRKGDILQQIISVTSTISYTQLIMESEKEFIENNQSEFTDKLKKHAILTTLSDENNKPAPIYIDYSITTYSHDITNVSFNMDI